LAQGGGLLQAELDRERDGPQRDGVAQLWVDGVLYIDRHDLEFRTGAHPTLQFNQFVMAPYIGDGSPRPIALVR
jgi:hypothetical protein